MIAKNWFQWGRMWKRFG